MKGFSSLPEHPEVFSKEEEAQSSEKPASHSSNTFSDRVPLPTNRAMQRIVNRNGGLLTPKEAAAYIQMQESTLAVWRCTQRYALPYVKVGRLVRYRISDLDAFLLSRTVGNVD